MKALIEKIEVAFANVQHPGEEALTESFGEEAAALIIEFRDKTKWRALDADFLNQAPDGWGSALSFFSAAALQLYLPAYLIADIKGTLLIGDATTRLCAFVMPQQEHKKLAKFYGGGTLGEHARTEFARFSALQVSAIVSYLWWKLENEGYNPTVEQALENFWLEREAHLNEKKGQSC